MSSSHQARTPDETLELGRLLARRLGSRALVWLTGPLGSGKTLLAKGLFAAYGVDPNQVVSPSFTLINRYGLDPPLYHVDLYRLERSEALTDLGLEEMVDGPGVVVVEWGERLEGLLAPPDLVVRITPLADETRRIRVEWRSGCEDGEAGREA